MAAVLGDVAGAQPLPADRLTIRPREDWAQGLLPVGPLVQEQPGDVRFLLVHHTASGNDYAPDDVPVLIRGFYSFHTGPVKNWPDVAYNFFIDRHGTAWEGRAGSLAGPVQPDATGGSQGFAQLCCFIGDHTVEAPTPEARQTMVALLATLADRYQVDPSPESTTTFVSRGSNRWPAGTPVTTPTIAGHRDMSSTTCPGDAAYALVRDTFPAEVTALLGAASTTPAPQPQETAPAPSLSPTPGAQPTSTPAPTAGTAAADVRDTDPTAPALIAGGAVTAGAAAALYLRGRRRRPSPGRDERRPDGDLDGA
ncbi:N-acetylmuramoyl-L-alanine amidase [Geodermatophilus nigrescens]